MEKASAIRVSAALAAAWKSRSADEGESEEPEGREKEGGESQPRAFGNFRLSRVIAAGVRRPAWGLQHIARPPPRPRS